MTHIPYTEVDETLRPLLDIQIAGHPDPFRGLADSGAVNSIFPAWIAEVAGVDFTGAEERHLNVGGQSISVAFATVTLSAYGHDWDAPVGFSEGWDKPWGLLGHEAFFRHFTVTFRAVDSEFELSPNEH